MQHAFYKMFLRNTKNKMCHFDCNGLNFQRKFGRVWPRWFPSLKGQEFFSLILTEEIFNNNEGGISYNNYIVLAVSFSYFEKINSYPNNCDTVNTARSK